MWQAKRGGGEERGGEGKGGEARQHFLVTCPLGHNQNHSAVFLHDPLQGKKKKTQKNPVRSESWINWEVEIKLLRNLLEWMQRKNLEKHVVTDLHFVAKQLP